MIAIGGAIGTGLIIGTGTALRNTGPASIVISYSLVGMLVYVVMVRKVNSAFLSVSEPTSLFFIDQALTCLFLLGFPWRGT